MTWDKIDAFIREQLAQPEVPAHTSYAEALIRYLGEHGTTDDVDLLFKVAQNITIEAYVRSTAIDALSRIRERENESEL